MSIYHTDYRPRSIADLDIPSVVATLDKVFKSKDAPRAFLFCGPKGSGKTSAARVVARVVNDILPEDRKNYIDIIEIDAASNRGIDDIRSLREKAHLLPAELKKKVFIIDEVHMLTKEAFNALLKILEEPPEHTVFVLCTTDPDDIPETVLSRLFRVDFRKASKEEVVASLNKIVKGEGLNIEKEVLEKIFEKSEGSFRNAAKILQEYVISDVGAVDFFEKKWGKYGFEEMELDLKNLKTKRILIKIEELAGSGVDMQDYTVQALGYFQKKLITGSDLGQGLNKWLLLLLNACKGAKDSPVPQLPLQLAVVEFLGVGIEVEKEQEIKSVGAAVAPEVVPVLNVGTTSVCSLEDVLNCWLKLITEVSVHNRSVGAFLKATNPKKINGGCLQIEVFYDFHKQQLSDIKNRQLLERCIELVVGKKLVVEFIKVEKTEQKVVEVVSPVVVEQKVEAKIEGTDVLYDVAKEIFG